MSHGLSTTSTPVHTSIAATCGLCGRRLPKRSCDANHNGADRHFGCSSCRQVFLLLCESGLIEGDFKSSVFDQTSLRLGIISNPEIETLSTPVDLKNTQELILHLEGMWCSACLWLIEKAVNAEPGVVHPRVIDALVESVNGSFSDAGEQLVGGGQSHAVARRQRQNAWKVIGDSRAVAGAAVK